MQQIKASVGKNNFLTGDAPLRDALQEPFQRANLVRVTRLSVGREPGEQLVFGDGNGSQLPHNNAGSYVGEADGFVKRQTGCDGRAGSYNPGVACTGYIEHFTSQRR